MGNGVQIMTNATIQISLTSLNPGSHYPLGSDPDYAPTSLSAKTHQTDGRLYNATSRCVPLQERAIRHPALATGMFLSSKFVGAASTYTITASAGTGGTITPSGAVSVNFRCKPNVRYCCELRIGYIRRGDRRHLSWCSNSITFTNVIANRYYIRNVCQHGYTITASATTGGSIIRTE